MLAFDQMANIFYFSIEQDDCPHTFITGQIEGLSIFIINTLNAGRKRQITTTLFSAKNSEDLSNALNLLKSYPGIDDLTILGKSGNVMSLMYSFPKTSAFRNVSESGFRLHPIVVRKGQEKWFFIETDNVKITSLKKSITDSTTRIIELRRVSTQDFLEMYSNLFSKIWTLQSKGSMGNSDENILTEAVRAGYYEWPRKTSISTLSDKMGIPASTMMYRMRKLEKQIMESFKEIN